MDKAEFFDETKDLNGGKVFHITAFGPHNRDAGMQIHFLDGPLEGRSVTIYPSELDN